MSAERPRLPPNLVDSMINETTTMRAFVRAMEERDQPAAIESLRVAIMASESERLAMVCTLQSICDLLDRPGASIDNAEAQRLWRRARALVAASASREVALRVADDARDRGSGVEVPPAEADHVAWFDSRAEAKAAGQRLAEAGSSAVDVRLAKDGSGKHRWLARGWTLDGVGDAAVLKGWRAEGGRTYYVAFPCHGHNFSTNSTSDEVQARAWQATIARTGWCAEAWPLESKAQITNH